MNFSLEIGPHTSIDTLPSVKDVYITLLPGGNYVETAQQALDFHR
jgi:methylenetetrahydrofolate reductase (NADPH)